MLGKAVWVGHATGRSRGWLSRAIGAVAFAFAGFALSAVAQTPTISLSANPAAIGIGASTTLNATVVDPAGTVSVVRFYDGSTLLATLLAPYTTTYTPSRTGVITLTAVAANRAGTTLATSAPVSLTVSGGKGINAPPTVSLSAAPTSVAVGAASTLTAVAADSDGTIASVAFYQGTTLLGQVTTSPYNFNFVPAAAGNFSLTAVATDNQGAQTTSNAVTVTATAVANNPPTVSLAAAPASVAVGATSVLTATPNDTDGTISKVQFFDGSTQLGQLTAAPWTFNFVPSTAGVHSLHAVAFDNLNAQGTSNVVSVTATASGGNAPPVVSLAAAPSSIAVGAASVLTATASDSDGTVAKVEFYQGATLVSTATTAPYKYTYTGQKAGVVSFTAVATDNAGASTTSAAVNVYVATNQPPTVSLASSSTSLVIDSTPATLTATASDPDGTISKVEFYNGATLISTDTTSPYTATFTPTVAGAFSITAKAYDNQNASTTSSPVTIQVAAAPLLPRISLSMSNTLFAPGASVTLTGTAAATATGATVTRVSFYMNGAKLVDVTAAPYTTTVPLPNAGNYLFYAEVMDSVGQIVRTLNQKAVVQTAPAIATTDPDIWRLLNQATFGASQAEAARVVSLGIPGWINDQLTKPISGYPDTKYNRIQLTSTPDCTTTKPSGTAYPSDSPQAVCARDQLTLAMVQRDFFTNATYGSDQLRQRVAWALSQIVVTSANEPDLSFAHVMSRYQNIMFNNAFGNYETLLRQVTYNPAMGNYLDMVNNDRAPAPPTTSTRVPNENYAREIQQLFSVGLYELKSDGTPLLDANNQPIPTYDQTDIAEFAKVFTGYTYANSLTQTTANGKQNPYYGAPMVPYPTTSTTGHDPNAKTLLGVLPNPAVPTVLPAGQTGQQDIDAAVHNVFMHLNTGPFVAKQLIQRLVTGNPSPAYVARIAAVFADNGSGVRGDLAAVVKAILLDQEARGAVKTAADFGQLREPVLAVTGVVRALNGLTDGARLAGLTGNLGQQPYYSPTVFNYFMPDAKVPGTAILGPEFGIHTTVTAVGRANLIYSLVYGGFGPDTTVPDASGTKLFLAPFEAIADNPAAMVSLVNQTLAGGQFPVTLEPTIVTAVNAIAVSSPPTAQQRTDRARMAVYLMASSYDYQVQR
jgi:uncharacterized protein (DUF1800 family)